ncbi:hypothetical protein L227DRAFT_180716 [Lentinus tigrinus ALCF2SS1-6]|uniref:Uncharacterized protein n=1 Tax=Lentinus tigrinus ALCF2SS1-6 TaxID=1328759 RepID=A0A5C2S5T1_9APHY|nr:hypothetical protein L227DRAFT_180716 [Lentinus tigrinus ALCF2SS1-6]
MVLVLTRKGYQPRLRFTVYGFTVYGFTVYGLRFAGTGTGSVKKRPPGPRRCHPRGREGKRRTTYIPRDWRLDSRPRPLDVDLQIQGVRQ